MNVIIGGLEGTFFSLEGWEDERHLALWSAPEARLLWSANLVNDPPDDVEFGTTGAKIDDALSLVVVARGDLVTVDAIHPNGGDERLGTLRVTGPHNYRWPQYCIPSASAQWLGVVDDNDISIVTIDADGLSDRIPIGRHEGDRPWCVADPFGRFLLTATRSGEFRVWDVTGNQAPRIFDVQQDLFSIGFSTDGSHIMATIRRQDKKVDCWIFSIDESGLHLLRHVRDAAGDFDPVGLWLARKGPSPAWSLSTL